MGGDILRGEKRSFGGERGIQSYSSGIRGSLDTNAQAIYLNLTFRSPGPTGGYSILRLSVVPVNPELG